MTAPEGDPRLRWGWRALVWGIATLVAIALLQLTATGLSATLASAIGFAVVSALSLAAWRWLDRRSAGRTPLGPEGALRSFASGLVVGALLVGLVVAVLAGTGSYVAEPRGCEPARVPGTLLAAFALFLFAAALEEVLFRGYLLTATRDGLGDRWAIVATAILFGLVHLGNPNVTPLAFLDIAWIGAVLGLWVLRTGSLWGPIGAHAGWNFALASLAAIPVSGLSFGTPCWVGLLHGPEWWTGGAFGVEASPLSAVAWGLAGWWVLWRTRSASSRA